MITKLKYLPINWKNGMSFSEDHLKAQNLAMTDSIRDASALHLTNANYGLLGGAYQKKFADSFRDTINDTNVEIAYCRAITQDGSRIEILNQTWEELNIPFVDLVDFINIDSSKHWYLLLVIDPFTRTPEGVEVNEKGPRRKPNTRPAYQLELMSFQDIKLDNLANAIPLAKFETVSSGLRKVDSYIPSCTRVNSCEKLILKYEAYDKQLLNLSKSSSGIVSKIKHKRRNNEINRLADDIQALCEKYLDFFVNNYDHYKFTLTDLPPIKLVEFFAKLARVLNLSMDMAYDKSHMLKYFHTHATDVSESELHRILKNTFEVNYAHFDLSLTLEIVDKFMNTMDEVLTRLEQLDYIELTTKNIVKRNVISNSPSSNPQTKKRSSGSIIIKRSGAEENLEDGLVD